MQCNNTVKTSFKLECRQLGWDELLPSSWFRKWLQSSPVLLRPPAGPAELCRRQSPQAECLQAEAARLESAQKDLRPESGGGRRRGLTVAAVAQVGPDDVLLRETEDSQPSSSHGGVDDHARVHHHPRALVETHPAKWRRNPESCGKGGARVWGRVEVEVLPDVAVRRAVLQEPAVGGFVLPADVAGVLPQKLHLVAGVAGVPERVPQVLTRARE